MFLGGCGKSGNIETKIHIFPSLLIFGTDLFGERDYDNELN
jgi:hypothetical protein